MSDITEKNTHEFCQGEVACLYPTIRYLLQILGTINDERLKKLVQEKIQQIRESSKNNLSDDTLEDRNVIKKTRKKLKTTNHEDELEALAFLSRTILSVVFVKKNDQIVSSVYVCYYGRKISSLKKCVYMIYDETLKHYAPL